MLRGLANVSYWAEDVEAAMRWYADVLGVEPYFRRSGPDGRAAYAEFRLGDHQDEMGIVDRRYAPGGTSEPGGAVVYWHVDDVRGAYERLLSKGAKEYEPPTERGDSGFVTASVVDPFGNVLGVMYNPHYVDVVDRIPPFELPPIEHDAD